MDDRILKPTPRRIISAFPAMASIFPEASSSAHPGCSATITETATADGISNSSAFFRGAHHNLSGFHLAAYPRVSSTLSKSPQSSADQPSITSDLSDTVGPSSPPVPDKESRGDEKYSPVGDHHHFLPSMRRTSAPATLMGNGSIGENLGDERQTSSERQYVEVDLCSFLSRFCCTILSL